MNAYAYPYIGGELLSGILSAIVLVVVSLATPAPDKSITDVFDKVRN